MTSNVSQNYPYSSETNEERAARLDATFAAHDGLRDKVKGETTALTDDERWWVWKCPTPGFTGLLHVAGYARDSHAIYAVCDTCAKTFLR